MSAWARRLVGAARVAATLGVALYALHTLLPGGGPLSWLFERWVYDGVLFAFAAICLARAIVPGGAGWGWLGGAILAWAAGDAYYTHVLSGDPDPPYPSLADAGYLAFFPLAYAGFIVLVRTRVRRLTASVWLDGITAGCAIAALAAAFVLEAVLNTTSGNFAAVATNLSYPLGDMLLVALVVCAFALMGWRPGRAWYALGTALVVMVVADSIYLYQVAVGTYVEGTILDASWLVAMGLLANAAWLRRDRTVTVDAAGRALLLVPATCVAIAVGVLVLDHFRRLNPVALTLAVATLGCVVARLGLTFRENRRLLDLTRSEAVTDPLTGLGNRRALVTDLDRALANASSDSPWLLVVFDLDGFKGYNDAFGHPAGDALLARLGARLAAVPDPAGAAYRFGGDEFCLLAPASSDTVQALVDASVRALSDHGDGFRIDTSFGAVILPDDATDPRAALGEADARLYAQKHTKHARRDRPHDVLLQALFEREPDLAVAAGRRLGLGGRELEEVERAAQLHDIGKIAVPDQILRKPGALDAEEWHFIRQHTVVGERILSASPALRRVGEIVRASHERWDGDGYPDGLAGDEIPLAARIIAVCDAYDAMTETRPYRRALTHADALRELERGAGTQFDPAVVAVVSSLVREQAAAA